MVKVAIKSEKLSPFGGIFHVREQFSRFVGPVIDKVLGLRCTSYGYQSARLWVLCQVSTSVAATVWRNNGFGWNRFPKSFMGEKHGISSAYGTHTKLLQIYHGKA